MKKRKTWYEAVLVGGIVLVVLLVVAYTVALSVTRGKAQSELDKIRAMGEPVTAADLAPEPVPDEANGAVIYEKAFALMNSASLKSDLQLLDDFGANHERKKRSELWDKAEPAVDRCQPVFDVVAEAVSRPECQFPLDWATGGTLMFPHYSRLRRLARLEAAAALVYGKQGNMERCVDAVDNGLKVSESVKNEPMLIALLVRMSMLNIAMGSLQESLESGTITESQARRLDSTLATIDLHDGFVQAMMGERAMGMWYYDMVKRNPVGVKALRGDKGMENLPMFIVSRGIGRPILHADQTYYLRYMTEQIEMSKKPYVEVAGKMAKSSPAANAPAYAPLAKVMCPVFTRGRQKIEDCMARVAVTRVALGLLAYRERFGAYPQTLGELKTKLGWVLLKDPFDGKDLKYNPTSDGFVLYSIGANMQDEGGKAPDSGAQDPNTGDVVWRASGR